MVGVGILQDIDCMVKFIDVIVKLMNFFVMVKICLGWDDKMMFIEEVVECLQDVGIKVLLIYG